MASDSQSSSSKELCDKCKCLLYNNINEDGVGPHKCFYIYRIGEWKQ
jgi:hypothetical protein